MSLVKITTTPTPLWSVADVKAKCGISATDTGFDAELSIIVASATLQMEHYTGLSLSEITWKLVLDQFDDEIELPCGPVYLVPRVQYIDAGGLLTVLPASQYTLDLVGSPQWLIRNEGVTWPDLGTPVNGVEIEFSAGYGPALCPADLKLAVLNRVHEMFDPCASGASGARGSAFGNSPAFGLAWPYRQILI